MNGILLVDKQKDYTSHDVVAVIKKVSKEKVGHTGTLDPNATGVLPLLVGKATGVSKYLINHDKTYIATLKLGIKTDTADGEGKVLEEKEVSHLQIEDIQKALNKLVGKQEQVPPMYSAIKVNGKKLYEYARQGKQVEVQARKIEIYDAKLIEYNNEEEEVVFEVSCSKGTYIRTVCENVAENLNTIGFMKELRRTRVGEFDIQDTVKIEEIKNKPELLEKKIITIEKFFKSKEQIELNNKDLELFLNGVKLSKDKANDIYRIYNNNKFIGLGVVEDNKLKRDIIINL